MKEADIELSSADARQRIEELERSLEQKSLEIYSEREQLKYINQYFTTIIQRMAGSLIVVDQDLFIELVNDNTLNFLGYKRNELEGVPLSNVMDTSALAPDAVKAGASNDLLLEKELTYKTKDGTAIPVLFSASPMRAGDTHDELIGIVCVATDLRERKLFESQLLQAEKLESVGRLAAGIAHEINTPIQFVGDNLRFLLDGFKEISPILDQHKSTPGGDQNAIPGFDAEYLKAEIPLAITQSLDGVARITKIVQAMKEFSHPGSEAKQAVDINRLLQSAITVSTNEWKYVAEVVTNFDKTLPFIQCLPAEMNQVFLNIIVNAAHSIGDAIAGKPGGKGKITISTSRVDDMVEARFEDTGKGIPKEIQSKIFEPFFTTKAVGKGTGQGLTLARSIVADKHGGTLGFESNVGSGATFIIRLPLDPRSAKGN